MMNTRKEAQIGGDWRDFQKGTSLDILTASRKEIQMDVQVGSQIMETVTQMGTRVGIPIDIQIAFRMDTQTEIPIVN